MDNLAIATSLWPSQLLARSSCYGQALAWAGRRPGARRWTPAPLQRSSCRWCRPRPVAQLGVAAQRRQFRPAHEDDAGFAQPIDDVERLQHVAAEATQLSHEMMRSLVQPWPDGWPDYLLDLNAAAIEAGIEIPPRAENHLHPRVHAEWNRELFELIRRARES